ncbi:MAG TPA: site-specific integrase [Hyphomicrobiaceae bacterium]|jgi:integrase
MAEALDNAFDCFFAQPSMSGFDIKAALRAYLRSELQRLRAKHLATPYGEPVHATEVDYPYDVHAVREADLNAIDWQLRQRRKDLRERNVEAAAYRSEEVVNGHPLSPTERVELALGILRANIQALQQSRDWLTQGLAEEIKLDEPAPELSPPAQSALEPIGAGGAPKLSEVLPTFLDFMVRDQGWRGQTLAQSKTTYDMFIECCGDRAVSQYQRKDLRDFYDLLRGLPALYSKSKEWSGLPLAEIVERTKGSDHQRLTMKTMKRHFSALGRLFTYLRRRGEYVGENPAHGFEFPDKRRAKDKRKMWEGGPLKKLFASPVWRGCLSEGRRSTPGSKIIEDEKYWLPILGLFHGNRLEEFAQLRRSDVRCSDGIWFLDINDEGTKQVKNEQSKRRVPIHPRVKKLGLLKYVERVAPNASDQVFPNLRPGGADNKLGFTFTKWWTRYRQDIGVYEKGLDYHSFRHGVATKLAAAGVSLDARNELLGHEGKSVDERVYQKGLPLKVLADAVARVEWPEFTLGAEKA